MQKFPTELCNKYLMLKFLNKYHQNDQILTNINICFSPKIYKPILHLCMTPTHKQTHCIVQALMGGNIDIFVDKQAICQCFPFQ